MFHVPTQAGKYWQLQTPVQIVCQQCLTDWRIPHTMEVSWTVAAVLAGDAPHLEGLYLLFVSIQIFETWKKSRKLLLLVALCAICWCSWVLGLKLPKVNFTLILASSMIFNATSIFATAAFRVCQTAFVACFSCQNPQFFGQPQQRKIVSQESSHVWLFLTY